MAYTLESRTNDCDGFLPLLYDVSNNVDRSPKAFGLYTGHMYLLRTCQKDAQESVSALRVRIIGVWAQGACFDAVWGCFRFLSWAQVPIRGPLRAL